MVEERKDIHTDSVREALINSRNAYEAMVDYDKMIRESVVVEGGDAPESDIPPYSNRLMFWSIFSEEVERHISDYTVPQYGDFPEDQMTSATETEILHNIKRYVERYGSNARGNKETDLDLLKIAHYASILWGKRMGFEAEMKKLLESTEAEIAEELDKDILTAVEESEVALSE